MGFTVNTAETDYGAPPVYGSIQAMVDRFGEREMIQISDRSGQANGVDEAAVQRALEDAGAEIDGYLAGRYKLPLSTVPRVLVNVGCDITRYRLYDDRVTEAIQKRYDDAVKFLTNISTGKIGLGLDTTATAQVPTNGGPTMDAPARVFSRETLSDY